ncbi:MAG: hypothetical protein WBG69_03260, partial [Arcobacteraceae bacterium]
LPLNQERDDFTQGCIALDNEKITNLDKKINIENSVLVISEKKLQSVSKEDLTIVLSNIFKWRDAWKDSDITAYLSYYHADFKKSNGQSLEDFSKYKTRVFNKDEKKTIEFYNINVIPYPNEGNKKIFKIVMDEKYKTKTFKFNGKKELYVEVLNETISILAES